MTRWVLQYRSREDALAAVDRFREDGLRVVHVWDEPSERFVYVWADEKAWSSRAHGLMGSTRTEGW